MAMSLQEKTGLVTAPEGIVRCGRESQYHGQVVNVRFPPSADHPNVGYRGRVRFRAGR